MRSKLQNQLLKAGLASEQQAKVVSNQKKKQKKQPQDTPPDPAPRVDSRAAQVERDRLLNEQRQAETQRKAVMAQIRQIIEQHRLPPGKGDIAYHFVDHGKVKRLYLDRDTQAKLERGQLALALLDNHYHILPLVAAEKISARDPAFCVIINRVKPETDPEDPYADYPVPDDLMW